jgi:hypothetical protein
VPNYALPNIAQNPRDCRLCLKLTISEILNFKPGEFRSVLLLVLRDLPECSYSSSYVALFVTRPTILAETLLRKGEGGRQKRMRKHITIGWKNNISRK